MQPPGRAPAGPRAPIRRLFESPLARKITKYTIGSVLALLTSIVVFALLLWAGVGTTADSVLAFIAGAVPNWILNRRWAWQRAEQKLDFGREIVGYTLISLLSLAAASAGTGWTHAWVTHHLASGDGLRVMLVTGSYVLVQGLLFAGKFLAYDRWVFSDGRGLRAIIRARLATAATPHEQ